MEPSPGFTGIGLACRRGERLVFRGLDFTLRDGGALILTGTNGSGKSSLLRLMAGLGRAEAGAITWNGEEIIAESAAHRARIHFIGHQDALKPRQGVRETLAFWAGMHGGNETLVEEALRRFRLGDLAPLPCRYLSQGQRRRLVLARLLASPAPLWLLDEPATALDQNGIADLLAAIAAHRQSGGRVVLSTHQSLAIEDAATLLLDRFAPRAAA
ncbi:MAG TPA: heme ABC exporter ATP-binding protein CcmA [Stellaceae bacterium]|nr:heme ABC exporter ATP-binding protein CcmA [Stellaceae bacterium]